MHSLGAKYISLLFRARLREQCAYFSSSSILGVLSCVSSLFLLSIARNHVYIHTSWAEYLTRDSVHIGYRGYMHTDTEAFFSDLYPLSQ